MDLLTFFTTNNKSGYKSREDWLKKNQPDLYNKIKNFSKNKRLLFKERILFFIYNLKERPKCPVCKKNNKFLGSIKRGYSTYCSSICSNKSDDANKKKSISSRKRDHKDIVKKREKTMLERYEVKNPMLIEEVKNKVKKTNKKRYGVESVFQRKDVIKKIKQKSTAKSLDIVLKKLNIDKKNVSIKKDIITIRKYCKRHKSFSISKKNLDARIKYKTNLCTKCYPISNGSISEDTVRKFVLNELKLPCEKIRVENKEIDIFIPSKNVGIEYNGLFWHSNQYLADDYHIKKTEICEKHNIRLIHIFEDEWINKMGVVKSILRKVLGADIKKISSRVCSVSVITNNKTKKFLEDNHIFGYDRSGVKIGLFHKGLLVSVMTFSKKKGRGVGEYQVSRCCDMIDIVVEGGTKKMFDFFIKKYKPVLVTSYSDRRYFDGGGYKDLGFKFVGYTKPCYYYFMKKSLERKQGYLFRKCTLVKEGYDPNMSENDIMTQRGFLKIFDCGNIKYEYKKPISE